uniref:Uncharacterized protein n=1 Tax=Opuntia streptacantha TaxID=393608 RepID=A0A7C9E287_OPUST
MTLTCLLRANQPPYLFLCDSLSSSRRTLPHWQMQVLEPLLCQKITPSQQTQSKRTCCTNSLLAGCRPGKQGTLDSALTDVEDVNPQNECLNVLIKLHACNSTTAYITDPMSGSEPYASSSTIEKCPTESSMMLREKEIFY